LPEGGALLSEKIGFPVADEIDGDLIFITDPLTDSEADNVLSKIFESGVDRESVLQLPFALGE